VSAQALESIAATHSAATTANLEAKPVTEFSPALPDYRGAALTIG
jgi:hypothetical protein